METKRAKINFRGLEESDAGGATGCGSTGTILSVH